MSTLLGFVLKTHGNCLKDPDTYQFSEPWSFSTFTFASRGARAGFDMSSSWEHRSSPQSEITTWIRRQKNVVDGYVYIFIYIGEEWRLHILIMCIIRTLEVNDMNKRINITLPEKTVQLLDRVAQKGTRSRLIDRAVRRYVVELGRANLRRRLKEGAIREAELDLQLAEEWFPLEEEAWREHS